MRSHRLPLFSVDTHRPASEFDLIAFNLSAELVYTNVLELHRPRGRARARRRPRSRASAHRSRAATAPTTPSRSRTSSIGSRSATARRSSPRSPRSCAAWKASGRTAGSRERVLHELATIPGVYVPSMYDVEYDDERLVSVTPRVRGRARGRRQAHDRRPRGLALPAEPARAVDRSRARPTERRGVPRLHPRVPLLPGGDDHAAGTRTSRGASAHDGRRGLASHGLRRGEPHLAVDRGLQWCRARRRRRRERSREPRAGLGLAPEPAGRRVHRRDRGDRRIGAAHGPHVRPRGGLVASADGHQQAHHRGRPVRRRRVCVLAGLDADEALLPHRPSHRARRRHARHRRAREGVRGDRQALHASCLGHRVASAGSSRSRTHRSSGSARTPSTSCSARSSCCATRPGRHAGCS